MTDHPTIDRKSLAGKLAAPRERFDLVVVGAGPAGTAAALAAAAAGLSVKLVDENPVDPELIGLDVPLLFGGRANSSVQDQGRKLADIAEADPAIGEAFEAGVDVALATTCWGVFLPGPALETLPGPVVALADRDEAWLCGFDRLILATGARDLVYSFAGADQPGIVGVAALHALLSRYDAFDGRRLVVLGSDDLALDAAERALARGLEVAALVEVGPAPLGDAARVAALAAAGVAVLTGSVLLEAKRGPFGVAAAVIGPSEAAAGDGRREIACDTICLAIGRAPVVDLLDAAGGRLVLDGTRGGYAPATPDGVATSLASVFVAGDCVGVGAGPGDAAAAVEHGRRAAAAALHSLGRGDAPAPGAAPTGPDLMPRRLAWMSALLATGGPDVLVCQCEEVTRGDLLGVRPPRYLGVDEPANRGRDLAVLAGDGPISHDQMKRLTRVTMGACQGRRCREQVAMTMALGTGAALKDIPLAGYRAPVRPLPLSVLATFPETEAMDREWDVWFGIPTQWVPYDAIGTERERELVEFTMHM